MIDKNIFLNNLKNMKVRIKQSPYGVGLFAINNLSCGEIFCLEEYPDACNINLSCEEYLSLPLQIQELIFHYYTSHSINNLNDTLFILPDYFIKQTNFIYYINHSNNPNITFEVNNNKTYIKCLKNIDVNEELLFDYNLNINSEIQLNNPFSFTEFHEKLSLLKNKI